MTTNDDDTRRFRRHRFWLGIALVVLALVSLGQTAWYSWEQQKCNEAFSQNLSARVEWEAQDRRALNNLIISVFTDDRDHEQIAAYRHWLKVTERNAERRARTPLPPLAACD